MKSKKFTLLNIEIGTFTRQQDHLILTLDRSQLHYERLSELDSLKKLNPLFLPVVDLVERNNQLALTYQVPDQAQSLKNLPTENKAIRTAIAKTIMDQDVTRHGQDLVTLNPANLWYYPMHHVWYAYQANSLMPFDDSHDYLSQYKALILFCLTGTPYERLLDEPTIVLGKEVDTLLQQVLDAESFTDLKEIVTNIDDFVSYQTWQTVERNQHRVKSHRWLAIGLVGTFALMALVFLHQRDEKKYTAVIHTKQIQLTQVKQDNKIQIAFSQKRWSKAKKLMAQAGYSQNTKISRFLKFKKYQQALNLAPDQLARVVHQAYLDHNSKQLLTWTLTTRAANSIRTQLHLEKAIVAYDTNLLNEQLPFTTDTAVLLRMGQAYLNHKDSQAADSVYEKLVGLNMKKARYMKALLKVHSSDLAVNQAQEHLDDMRRIDAHKDKNKDEKVSAAQADLKSTQNDQKIAKKQVVVSKARAGD